MKRKTLGALALALTLSLTVGMLYACAAPSQENPIAENLELRTYRGVSIGGQLKATDPDGDMLKYEVTTEPIKGEVALKDDGSFVYTPAEGKRGHDYFGYKAVDSKGNKSSEATVVIKIEKQKSKIAYSDMGGSGAYLAAVRLAEEGVFVGEQLGGQYVFCPERAVTRGEFLTMCISGSPICSMIFLSTSVSSPRISRLISLPSFLLISRTIRFILKKVGPNGTIRIDMTISWSSLVIFFS